MRMTKIHPITYIIYYVILILFAFLFTNPYYNLTYAVCILILIRIQGIQKEFKGSIKGFLIMGAMIAIINPLTSYQGVTRIYLWNNYFITLESVIYGVILSFCLILMLLAFTSFNKAVSYQDLLYVFSKKFPTVSIIMVMALRFIPLLSYRLEEINRLHNFENGNSDKKGFVNKIKNLVSGLIVMISWTFEESMITAKSMKARGYKTAKRTSYLFYRINRIDVIFISFTIVTAILSVLGLIYGNGRITIYPTINFSFSQFPLDVYYLSFLLLLLPLIYLEIKEEMVWH
ncbi:MAG: energy-coupling factor transporter transmembrane protein EcfT [Methanobrevibacter sp.]|jgi:energy-coupling factor transport system permease protein|nr:energy-coupling factor transporter transmembrane protein EcfT [Candidatus Methanovirga aequatorialis]